MQSLINLWHDTGLYHMESGQVIMMLVGFLMLFLAIKKGFEPLLLLPIAVGTLMVNIPGAGLGWSAAEAAIRTGDASLLAQFRDLRWIGEVVAKHHVAVLHIVHDPFVWQTF